MTFDDLLKSLQQDYLASLPGKIQLIEQLIVNQDTDNIRESFHKLKGTGRTYGFPEVSDLAEVVEDICLQKPAAGIEAATKAVPILQSIYQSRRDKTDYSFATDGRVAPLRKLLQSA